MDLPPGLVYRAELLSEDEGQRLLEMIEPLEFHEIRMHGVVAKRTSRHLGFELELAPRSGYVLAGDARTKWQHHIPPAKSLRYSITFRTLRNPERWT